MRWGTRTPSGAGPGAREELVQEPVEGLVARAKRAIGVPVAAGIVVLVLAVAGAVGITVMTGGGKPPAPAAGASGSKDASTQGGNPGSGASTGASSGPSGQAEGAKKALFVHVIGEVSRPGVIEVPAGSRVSEAISAAGGPTPKAVLSAVNLARLVTDGEQLLIPDEAAAASAVLGPGTAASPGAARAGGPGMGPIPLNRASAADLQSLPGIGPALSERIIAWREEHGGFTSVDQLDEVSGVGAKLMERLRDRVIL